MTARLPAPGTPPRLTTSAGVVIILVPDAGCRTAGPETLRHALRDLAFGDANPLSPVRPEQEMRP